MSLLKTVLKKIYNSVGRSYPRIVAVGNHNVETVDFIKKINPKAIAEIGIYKGHTTMEIIKNISQDTELYLFDFDDRIKEIKVKLDNKGFKNYHLFGNTYKYLDSYNTSLNALWSKVKTPIFDYVFLDGAHTFPIDCLTFFICDKLLKKGGYIDFDDYNWDLVSSPSQGPKVFPLTKKLYSDQQIKEKGIKMIIENYILGNDNYKEIIKNKIYQKI